MKMSARLAVALGFCIGLVAMPAGAADRDQGGVTTPAASADLSDNAAPNCLLPGRLREVGGIMTLAPRRAVTLDAADCATRGGEPIESTTAAVE